MNFNWDQFTKEQYEKLHAEQVDDYVGAVHIGDISIDLVTTDSTVDSTGEHGEDAVVNALWADFYVLHEDTGYAYTKDGMIPYDFAEGVQIKLAGLPYEEFKNGAEKLFKEYISGYAGRYNLAEHAARPLVIW